MTGMLTAWRRQSDPQRVDTYTRWTLYLLLASGPLVALSLASGVRSPVAEAYVVLTVGQTLAAIGVVRSGLARLVTGSELSRRWLAALAATTVAVVVLSVVAMPLMSDDDRPLRALA